MRPTIYIGLGDTGIRAIAQAKKEFEDVYGVGMIPPCIAFLAIDKESSILEDKTLATRIEEDFVCCEADRQSVLNYIEKGNCSNWMFHNNNQHLPSRYNLAANQVRTTGRFFAEYMLKTIDAALQQRWLQVSNITYTDEKGLAVPCQEIDIHVVMSLAGGTGAGSFINVAELISRKYGKRAHIFGYGVLHGVFRTQDPYGTHTPKVRVNAYASVLDLDYLMHASRYNPIKLEINGREREFVHPIFDGFFVIDNVTESGLVLSDIRQVCESVATGLFVSTAVAPGVLDAAMVAHSWVHGKYDVLQKKGWVHSLGACRVVYKGEQLAQIYGYKAAMELIRSIRQEGADAQQYAQQWTEEAGVREDGEQYNMLIDSIVEPMTIERQRILQLCVTNTIYEIRSDVANYIGDMSDMPSDACIKKMMEEKKQLLVAKVKQLLSQKNGVGNSRIFLDSLIRLCDKYRYEKVDEIGKFNIALENKSSILERVILEYKEYCDRLFKTRSGKEERLEIVSKFAKDIRKINYEIKRREIARDIFICLVKEARELSHKIDTLDEQLGSLCADYTQSIERLQNAENSMFEYDLSVDERMNMTLKYDFSIAELVNSLPVSLLDLDIEKQLRPAIEQYVATLPQAVKYREENITDVIEELSGEDYEELKYQIDVRSSRLLRIDDRGQMCSRTGRTPSEQMYRRYFYSIYSPNGDEQVHEQTRLERDVAGYYDRPFREFVLTNAESLRQQITILSVGSAIIPYCIEALNEDVVEEYERQVANANMGGATFNPHFDKNIYEQMKAQNFSLKPEC